MTFCDTPRKTQLLPSLRHAVGLGVGDVCGVGEAVGVDVGSNGVGLSVGTGDGCIVGEAVGDAIGSGPGVIVGAGIAAETGLSVILFVVSSTVPNATTAAVVIVILLYIITPWYVHQT